MPAAKKSWLDGSIPYVVVGAAIGIAALTMGALAMLRRRSAQAQSSLEREIDEILTPAERTALDVEAARARAAAEER